MSGAVIRYAIRRFLWLIALLFGLASAIFVIFYLFPSGDAAVLRAGPHPTPQLVAGVRHRLGLNEAWYVQYYDYMKALILHFDFGYSYQAHATVRSEIFSRLPATISLTVGAVILWLIAVTTVGTVAAVKRGSLFDRFVTGAAPLAISAPVFWLGMVTLYLFASDIGRLAILPGAGRYVPLTQDPGTWFASLIMPWCVLAVGFAAASGRHLRAGLIETLSEGYVRTARAKGLSERRVILRHALRAASAPVLSAAALGAGLLLLGALLTETVFNIPGIGRLTYDSIQSGDLPTIQGAVLLSGCLVVIARLVVDVAYALIDPRRVRVR